MYAMTIDIFMIRKCKIVEIETSDGKRSLSINLRMIATTSHMSEKSEKSHLWIFNFISYHRHIHLISKSTKPVD